MINRSSWQFRSQLLVSTGLIGFMVLLTTFLTTSSSAQTRECRMADALKICANTFVATDPNHFIARDDVTLAIGDAPPLISVGAVGSNLGEFVFAADQSVLSGAVKFIGDNASLPLVASTYNANNTPKEVFEVDTTGLTITNDQSSADPIGVIANSTISLHFLDRSGVRSFYKTTDPSETEDLSFVFDLAAAEFRAELPINLNISALNPSTSENPNLNIVVNLKYSQQGVLSGSVDNFTMSLAGMSVAVKEIALSTGAFEAGLVEVSRAANPDLPNLDPAKPNLVFSLQNLKYANRSFSIGGGSVPIPDWKFGGNFSMTDQTLSIGHDNATGTSTVSVNSTLIFGNVLNQPDSATPREVTLTFSAVKVNGGFKPVFSATVAETTVAMGPLNFRLRGLTLVGDTVENFYGLEASAVDLLWSSDMGGQSAAGITGFKFGIDKDGKLQFALGGATISTPNISSGVLQGSSIVGQFGVTQQTLSLTVTGNLQVKIPGNSGVGAGLVMVMRGGPNVAPIGSQNCAESPCIKRFEASLTNFSVKIAGFSMALENPHFLDDGGFAADSARLSMSDLMGNLTADVSGLSISGRGEVSVTGGGIELPPLKIAGTNFVGFRGFFSKDGAGYMFAGGATLSMPGFDPSGGSTISVDVTVKTLPTGVFNELDVLVAFESSPGIPLANSGAALTKMSGSFSLKSGSVTIGVGIEVSSVAQLAGIPLVSAEGTATLVVDPFKFSLTASMKVLIFEVASASVEIGHEAGFSGGKGLHAKFQFEAVIVRGGLELRVGTVTVRSCTPAGSTNCVDQQKLRFAGSAHLSVGLRKGQFGRALPPKNITFGGVSFQMGEFEKSGGGTTVGMLGRVSCCFNIFKVSVFVDLSKPVGLNTGFVKLVNPKNYRLINSLQIAQSIEQGEAGYSQRIISRPVNPGKSGGALFAAIPEVTVPVVITSTASGYFGIHFSGTPAIEPVIRLILPDGTELNEANVNDTTQTLIRDYTTVITEGNDLAFMLEAATPGTYSLIIEGPPSQYEVVAYQLNNPPVFDSATLACGGAATPGVTVTCNSAPTGSKVTVNWATRDTDDPNAKVSLVYASVITPTNPIDVGLSTVISDNIKLGTGQHVWDLSEIPSGQYKLALFADDGHNQPTVQQLDTLIVVNDQRAPKIPTNLQATPLPGQLLVKWTPNSEMDLGGYEIGFGEVNDPNEFLYSRNMGGKEMVFTATNQLDARLWGLKDNQSIFYGIRAYDLSGNYSAWSPLVVGTPWSLSPHAWNPVPGGRGVTTTQIEAAFETPLSEASLSNAFQVRNASNQLVAGTPTYLYNLDKTEIIGFSFKPSATLLDGETYTVTIRGGANGIRAKDGRQMPADFSWKFEVESYQIYLPVVKR